MLIEPAIERGYPRRNRGPIVADRGQRIFIYRRQGTAPARMMQGDPRETSDDKPQDRPGRTPGRPHMSLSTAEWAERYHRIITVPGSGLRDHTFRPLHRDWGAFGVHHGEPNSFPWDHAVIEGFFWERDRARQTVQRMTPQELNELYCLMWDELFAANPSDPSLARSVAAFPQGAVVGVSFGETNNENERIPCVVVSSASAQAELRRFGGRVTVVQTVEYEAGDEREGEAGQLFVLPAGKYGLRAPRTVVPWLIRTVSRGGRNVLPWNTDVKRWRFDEWNEDLMLPPSLWSGLLRAVDLHMWGTNPHD